MPIYYSDITVHSKLTIGVDDTGHDVQFFGATAGKYMLWDESADALVLPDATPLKIGSGTGAGAEGDLQLKHTGTNSEINNWTGDLYLTQNANNKDIIFQSDDNSGGVATYLALDGSAKTIEVGVPINIGVDNTGYDVKFFGATSGQYMLWDESADTLFVTGEIDAGSLDISGNVDVDGTLETDNLTVGGAQGSDGQVLTSTGSGVAWEDAAGGSLSGNNYATDLKIGRDADNLIDFTTDNEITFRVSTGNNVIFKASGEIEAASLDISGNVDIDGTLEADAITVNGTTLANYIPTVNANKITVTDNNNNEAFPVVFHDEGGNTLLDDTGVFKYNPNTGTLYTNKLTVTSTSELTSAMTLNAGTPIIFEGATADAHETSLSIVDPTGDRTQYIINQSGYIPVLSAATTTAITSTPAELNILDGATVVVGEINYNDLGSTAIGTAVASKTVVLDSNKDYTGIRNLTMTGGFTVGATASGLAGITLQKSAAPSYPSDGYAVIYMDQSDGALKCKITHNEAQWTCNLCVNPEGE
jgi:cytoskeletal protein CcmA (bactofilin family)